MKIKLITSMSDARLQAKANDFISNKRIKVLELQYSTTLFFFSVMIVYENAGQGKACHGNNERIRDRPDKAPQ